MAMLVSARAERPAPISSKTGATNPMTMMLKSATFHHDRLRYELGFLRERPLAKNLRHSSVKNKRLVQMSM